ncbi:MAG: hypothetical protein ACE5OR_05070, partial [bacterium]
MTDTVVIDQAYQSINITVDGLPTEVLLDRDNWILKEVTHITTPLVSCTDYSINDETGNTNGVPDPGEQVDLVVMLLNTGMEATGLAASISTQDPDVDIVDGTAEFGSLGYGQTASNGDDPIVFEVDAEAKSKVVLFVMSITADGGYSMSDSIYITIGPATILVVDDDLGEEYEEYYTDGLFLSYPFDLWEVATKGVPSETLFYYEAVVWLTGDERTSTLTSEEQTALKQYLDGGGHLFVTGQDMGYDLVETGSAEDAGFYRDYLHAEYVSDVSPDNILSGVSGDPISDDVSYLSLAAGGADNQDSPSIIEPLSGASSVFTYHPSGTTAGIKYAAEYRMVYFAFGYEGVGDFGTDHAKRRASIMDNVIKWFRYVPQKGDVNEDGEVNV